MIWNYEKTHVCTRLDIAGAFSMSNHSQSRRSLSLSLSLYGRPLNGLKNEVPRDSELVKDWMLQSDWSVRKRIAQNSVLDIQSSEMDCKNLIQIVNSLYDVQLL